MTSMRIKFLLPALAWLVIITFLSTKGGVPLPKFNLFQADKLAHAAAYALLAALLLWGLSQGQGLRRIHGAGTFVFASAYGMLMELVQYRYFPGRFFEYDDMLANTIGALAGWALFAIFIHRGKSRQHSKSNN